MHVRVSILNLAPKEDSKERKDTLVGPPRLCELFCTVDQLYFPWSKFQTQTPSSYSRASAGEASIKEGDEEAFWGKSTEYDGEVILDKKGV